MCCETAVSWDKLHQIEKLMQLTRDDCIHSPESASLLEQITEYLSPSSSLLIRDVLLLTIFGYSLHSGVGDAFAQSQEHTYVDA